MKDRSRKLQDTTRIAHGEKKPDPAWGAISTPIYQSSTFVFDNAAQGAGRFSGDEPGYIYTRMGNPTTDALESSLAALEEGSGGMATSSGMAAITTVFLALLNGGDHLISTAAVYGPSRSVLEMDFKRYGVSASFVNTADPAAIEAALRPETKLIFVETPANPTLEITDLTAVAALARAHSLLLVVDNTFSTPYLQKPLTLGADVVVHSLTKFINGHSDVVGGVIIPATTELFKKIRRVLNYFGGTMDPHQAWLVLRGLKTLALRMDRSVANARQLALFLEQHPRVQQVTFPGLQSHPQYELATRQMSQPGSMISFEVKGGIAAGRIVMDSVQLCILAVSLGGYETLIQHPASMTHAGLPAASRQEAQITDGLIRLSVGCEDADDLQYDLEQALNEI